MSYLFSENMSKNILIVSPWFQYWLYSWQYLKSLPRCLSPLSPLWITSIEGVTYLNHSIANSVSLESLNKVVGSVRNRFLSRCKTSRLRSSPMISLGIFLILLFESFSTLKLSGRAGKFQILLLLSKATSRNFKDVRSGIFLILFFDKTISFS